MEYVMAEEKKKGRRPGFMLLELVIVIAVVGIFAAVAVPNLIGMTDEAKVARIKADLATIGTATEMYYVKNGEYPTSLDTLVDRTGTDGFLKSLPEAPDKSVTYQLGSNGEVTAVFKGVTYSSFGTSSEDSSWS